MQSGVFEHMFQADKLEENSYQIFDSELEDKELIVFHGTPFTNLNSILMDGFKIPNPDGLGEGLPSVSFAYKSATAFSHAMNKRSRETAPVDYCIIAVRYQSFEQNGLKLNSGDMHDYTLDPPPVVIGYCKIPASYKWV